MKSSGILVNKEQLRSNYKLTFQRGEKSFFVFLHHSQKSIFASLRKGVEYNFFTFKSKGYKYFSVRPYSIKENRSTTFRPVRQMNSQNLLLCKMAKQVKLKEMTYEAVIERIRQVKNTTQDNLAMVKLEWLREKLDKRNFSLLTKKEKEERKRMEELKLLFYSDFIKE